MKERICKFCGYENKEGARFCIQCGKELPDRMLQNLPPHVPAQEPQKEPGSGNAFLAVLSVLASILLIILNIVAATLVNVYAIDTFVLEIQLNEKFGFVNEKLIWLRGLNNLLLGGIIAAVFLITVILLFLFYWKRKSKLLKAFSIALFMCGAFLLLMMLIFSVDNMIIYCIASAEMVAGALLLFIYSVVNIVAKKKRAVPGKEANAIVLILASVLLLAVLAIALTAFGFAHYVSSLITY